MATQQVAPEPQSQITIEPGMALAIAVKALEDLQQEFVDVKEDFKGRIANLRSEVKNLSVQIITGQKPLFPPSAGAN